MGRAVFTIDKRKYFRHNRKETDAWRGVVKWRLAFVLHIYDNTGTPAQAVSVLQRPWWPCLPSGPIKRLRPTALLS